MQTISPEVETDFLRWEAAKVVPAEASLNQGWFGGNLFNEVLNGNIY